MQQELEGALIALTGFAVGRFIPGRRKRPKPPKPIAPVCGCRHHKSFHDGDGCQATWGTPILDKYGRHKDTYGQHRCGCTKYEGPEPYTEFYPPEISS